MQTTPRASYLIRVADSLANGDKERAVTTAKELLPWEPSLALRTGIPKKRALEIFMRDRFVDRYSGSRLLFPGALLAFGVLLPDAFPMSPTWKVSESHEIFWELWPVIDHIIPVTRHGSNANENLVTTSAVNNSAKGTALLTELEWRLLPQPKVDESWDGMISWFLRMVHEHPAMLEHQQLRGWHNVLPRNAA